MDKSVISERLVKLRGIKETGGGRKGNGYKPFRIIYVRKWRTGTP